jgi:two-component system, LuxR family, response regulator FixJ
MDQNTTICLIDDDDGLLRSMAFMFKSNHFNVKLYDGPKPFLEAYDADETMVIITDYRMPEMTGLELYRHLQLVGLWQPIIMLTAYADIQVCCEAMRAGMFHYVEKSTSTEHLLDQVRQAIKEMPDRQQRHLESKVLRQRLSSLTAREAAVFDRLVSGRSMKEIAAEFGTSFQTVAKQRQRMLDKLRLHNDVELVKALGQLEKAAHDKPVESTH